MTPQDQITLLTKLVAKLSERLGKVEAAERHRRKQEAAETQAITRGSADAQIEVRALSIIEAVGIVHGFSVKAMIGRSASRAMAKARGEAIHRAHNAGVSYPVLSRIMGGRDHTSAMHLERVYLCNPKVRRNAKPREGLSDVAGA